MESRIQRIFLIGALLVMATAVSFTANADETKAADDDELGKIITPDLKRRTIKESDLDTENFELGLFYGLLTIEDFGTNEVSGVTFAYHITERFFTEAAFGISKLQKTSFELLGGGVELLTDEQRD
ncbi:MAG: outer membrane beta-barrel domain-containing protein, partial [Cellvibrio sp.]